MLSAIYYIVSFHYIFYYIIHTPHIIHSYYTLTFYTYLIWRQYLLSNASIRLVNRVDAHRWAFSYHTRWDIFSGLCGPEQAMLDICLTLCQLCSSSLAATTNSFILLSGTRSLMASHTSRHSSAQMQQRGADVWSARMHGDTCVSVQAPEMFSTNGCVWSVAIPTTRVRLIPRWDVLFL